MAGWSNRNVQPTEFAFTDKLIHRSDRVVATRKDDAKTLLSDVETRSKLRYSG